MDLQLTNSPLFPVEQVSLGGRFMSRPVIRAFVTYASWSDDFVGLVGGTDFANDSNGLTAGMHMEVWW